MDDVRAFVSSRLKYCIVALCIFTVTIILAASLTSSVVVVPLFSNVSLHSLFQSSLSYITSALRLLLASGDSI